MVFTLLVPFVLNCHYHNGGDGRRYIHVPHNLKTNLPSKFGDQLSSVVLSLNTLRPMREGKYSSIYTVNRLSASFGGVEMTRLFKSQWFDLRSEIMFQRECCWLRGQKDLRNFILSSEKFLIC